MIEPPEESDVNFAMLAGTLIAIAVIAILILLGGRPVLV